MSLKAPLCDMRYHAQNSLWYTPLKYSSKAWYTPFLKTLTAKWSWYRRGCGYHHSSVLVFLEQRVGVGERTCIIVSKGPCVTIAPERQGLKSGSHSRDGTTTILLSKFSRIGCTMLGDEYFSRVYHNEFLQVRPTRQDSCIIIKIILVFL